MPSSGRWSNASARCRLEWRPSRLLQSALVAIGILGALSLAASAAPGWLAWPLAVAAIVAGSASARRQSRAPRRTLEVALDATHLDGVRCTDAEWTWRGPIARLRWSEGRRRRVLLWWPDTLPAAARRELKLALAARGAGAATAAMAP